MLVHSEVSLNARLERDGLVGGMCSSSEGSQAEGPSCN